MAGLVQLALTRQKFTAVTLTRQKFTACDADPAEVNVYFCRVSASPRELLPGQRFPV